jgi:hypothetical protein
VTVFVEETPTLFIRLMGLQIEDECSACSASYGQHVCLLPCWWEALLQDYCVICVRHRGYSELRFMSQDHDQDKFGLRALPILSSLMAFRNCEGLINFGSLAGTYTHACLAS